MTETAFSSPAPGPPPCSRTWKSLGFTQMTPSRRRAPPLILEGRDLIAQAKTGSGKTAAFGLGLLQKINLPWLAPQCLVLCPTRELADQVAQELRRLARQISTSRC